jgi:CHAD domain-containing protein
MCNFIGSEKQKLGMILDFVKLKDIKPALAGYISDSQRLLKQSPFPDEDAVHDIRVLMKKLRATLKLLKTQLDDESFNRENVAYREIGHLLGTWRDSSVYRKTLKSLKKENPDLFIRLEDNNQISMMLARDEPDAEVMKELSTRTEQIANLLNKASFRIRFQSLGNLDPQLLLKELEQTYTVIADIYLSCRNCQKPERLHEFRKRAKDFLYQLYYFRPLNPGTVKALEKKLDMITQNLGKYNDLNQIIKMIGYEYGNPENSPALDELMVVIKDKQDQYLSKVWPSSYKIFCPGQKLLNVLGFRLLVI